LKLLKLENQGEGEKWGLAESRKSDLSRFGIGGKKNGPTIDLSRGEESYTQERKGGRKKGRSITALKGKKRGGRGNSIWRSIKRDPQCLQKVLFSIKEGRGESRGF